MLINFRGPRGETCASTIFFVFVEGSNFFKGALSGLIQFLAIEGPLKMMKNAFYFTSKALFVLKIFKFLS